MEEKRTQTHHEKEAEAAPEAVSSVIAPQQSVESKSSLEETSESISAAQGATPSLATVFLDVSAKFCAVQKEALAAAEALYAADIPVYIACPEDAPLAEKAREQGLHVISLGKLKGKEKKLGFFSSLFLHWKLRKIQQLCVHIFHPACLSLAQNLRARREMESTLLLHSCFSKPAMPLAKHWHNVDVTLCNTTLLREDLIQGGMVKEDLRVVHTAKALSPQFTSSSFTSLPKRCVFMVLEPLLPLEQGYGLDTVIKAMASLWQHPQLPDWEVRMVGKGPAFAPLIEEATSLGVVSRLALLGEQSWEEVLKYGHILICPNTKAEGNVPALMTAWTLHMPIIATTVPGHSEYMAGNLFAKGFMPVPPGDSQMLAASMIALIQENSALQEGVVRSQNMAAYAHMERLKQDYVSVYKKLLLRKEWRIIVN